MYLNHILTGLSVINASFCIDVGSGTHVNNSEVGGGDNGICICKVVVYSFNFFFFFSLLV